MESKDYTKWILDYIKADCEMLSAIDIEKVNEIMNILEDARIRCAQIYICGNGGSAATASHFAGDFNKGVSLTREKKYRFVCLSDNVPSMMAIANDIGYEQIFRQPLEKRITKEDVFIGISGSGNSQNVVLAAEYAKKCGAVVISLTGYDGGKLKSLSDYSLHVNIDNMQVVEDIHMVFNHLMMWCLVSGVSMS